MVRNPHVITNSHWNRAGWAITDQGLFSGTHFAVNIVLARWLHPLDYGAYAFAYSLYLLAAAVYRAFITEPALVFGGGRHKTGLRRYLGQLVRIHFLGTALAAGAFLATGAVLGLAGNWRLGTAVAALAPSAPLLLLFWMLRGACYIESRAREAAQAGTGYLIATLSMLAIAAATGLLSPALTFVLMGCAALASSLLLIRNLSVEGGVLGTGTQSRRVLGDHWGYGRWAALSAAVLWTANSGYYLLAALFLGAENVGVMKAFLNLIAPVTLAATAIYQFSLPRLAGLFDAGHSKEALRASLGTIGIVLGTSSLFALLLIALRKSILTFIYGDFYAQFDNMIMLLALILLLQLAANGLMFIFRAQLQPRRCFLPAAGGAVFTLLVGSQLILRYELNGVWIAMAGTWVAIIAGLALSFRKPQRQTVLT